MVELLRVDPDVVVVPSTVVLYGEGFTDEAIALVDDVARATEHLDVDALAFEAVDDDEVGLHTVAVRQGDETSNELTFTIVAPVEPEPPEPPIEPEPPQPVVPETLLYLSADGQAVMFQTEQGVTGRLMPPVDIWEDVVPLQAGSRYRGARHGARSVVVPIVTGGIRFGRAELRRLAAVLDPMRGMGALRVEGGEFMGRELHCVYQAGLDSLSEDFPHFSRAALVFRATDPYWIDTQANVLTFQPAQLKVPWFPIFPLRLGGANVHGDFNITNNGDADAWPTIDVTGPGSGFQLDNVTTGRFLALDGVVPEGTMLRIVTVPGQRGVRLGAENWYSRLSRGSTLFGLVPGLNQLRVRYVTEDGTVTFTYNRRYLTP